MANKKERLSKNRLKKIKQNKLAIVLFALVFLVVGVVIIYRSFASGITVFKDNPEYWRGRIAQCESGGNYQASNGTHFGAYQFDRGTWKGAVGPDLAAQYPDPRSAPADVQDQAFFNTFARRGTQPWNASYSCWIRGATVPTGVEDQINNVVSSSTVAPSPPAKPFGITSGSYNVIVNGRVTLNDAALAGVVIATCSGDRTVTTDNEGRFYIPIPVGTSFCLRPIGGIPEGAVLTKTTNNVQHVEDKTFENQIAGINCYQHFWCFTNPSFSWDRNKDAGYNFFYTKP